LKKEEIISRLSSVKEEIKKEFKADIKGIFGSYARMENRENSDIDILVDFDEEADLFDMAGLSGFLQERLNIKVDIVPRRSIREELKEAILKETLYI